MGKSSFSWEKHHFHGKIIIFMGKSSFSWENHYFIIENHHFIMENTIKMNDLGVPLFQETSI
jgi:hypothetical protein